MLVRNGRLRSLFLCLVLEVGALSGVPMRPEEIQRLMHSLSRATIVETLEKDGENAGLA